MKLGPHPLTSLKTAPSGCLPLLSFCQHSLMSINTYLILVWHTHTHTHPLILSHPLAIASFLYAKENFWKELPKVLLPQFIRLLQSGFCHQYSNKIAFVMSQMNSICHSHWVLFYPHFSHIWQNAQTPLLDMLPSLGIWGRTISWLSPPQFSALFFLLSTCLPWIIPFISMALNTLHLLIVSKFIYSHIQ